MTYFIGLSPRAKRHLKEHEKSGNKPLRGKISRLMTELSEHPKSGTGKPKPLKGQEYGAWSRRINDEHRLVYTIDDENMTVIIHSMHGHYDDK
jgi:toxin YoeB